MTAEKAAGEVVVRQAAPDDREAIFAFIRQAYAGRWQYKIPERWTWQHRDNPYLEPGELPIWIAVDADGRVVGQTCAMMEPVQLGAETCRLAWSVDTFLLPAFRGQGVGFRLQQANEKANPLFMSLSMSAANRRIKSGLGAVALPGVGAFDRPARYRADAALVALSDQVTRREGAVRRAASALFAGLGLHRLAAGALNRRLEAQDARRLQPPSGVEIRELDDFGPEADRLWATLAPHFTALVRRDREFLNWKFSLQPHVDHRKFAAYRDGEICGHLIFRCGRPPEANVGLIVDLFAAPQDQDTIDALLGFGVRQLQAAGVDSVEAASSVPAFRAGLRRAGFQKRKDVVPMLNCRLEPAVCRQAVEGTWLLGRGDHDWDQYPNA